MESDPNSSNKGLFIGILAVVLLAGGVIGGFVGGMNYQKNKATNGTTLSASDGERQPFQNEGGANGNRPRMMMSPGMTNSDLGTVTGISESSITLKSERTGKSKTYAITGDTQIEKDGTIAAHTDITTDAAVMVVADSKNTGNALRITINPAMAGRMNSGDVQVN